MWACNHRFTSMWDNWSNYAKHKKFFLVLSRAYRHTKGHFYSMVKLISIGSNFIQSNQDADKTCFPGKLDQMLDLSYYPVLPQKHNPSFLPSFLLSPSALCRHPSPCEVARSNSFNLFPQRK